MSRAFGPKTEEPPGISTVELASSDSLVNVERGSIYFIGTATMLIRYAGFTILTDPNFLHQGEYVRLGYGLRSRRLTSPAIPFEQLPPYDLVLLSHLHEDHFDRRVETLLDRGTTIVTTDHAAVSLTGKGFRHSMGLATWQELSLFKSPLSEFQQEVKAAGWDDRVRYLKHGETYNFEVPAPAVMKF
ncbi:MAG TPA: MBL fold metallo-hydrolase [Nitrospiraceae bacterium]|nr:MBL fold metallo-hydrolase [Nitrospiraceae bacterium]